ncbi:reverse transcriptase [Phytophthora megakarya]|uniref:Reverse transcriptase n=1 Tax=Phytophthora megakarya TaxID=4795 RepID=A0A225W0L9_9STRA|nr:reverse transcriptase [Phytophthora megakarya]
MISIAFVTPFMTESSRGNAFPLVLLDIELGYVMCKPMSATTAQDVAEVNEELVFQIIGASSVIRHDQDPFFILDNVLHSDIVHKQTGKKKRMCRRSFKGLVNSCPRWNRPTGAITLNNRCPEHFILMLPAWIHHPT